MSPTTNTTTATAARVPRRGAVLTVMCCGMFLVLLDVTVVNVALPSIGRDLGTGVDGMQAVVDGYAVAIAALLLGGGALGDRFGHRRLVLAGLAAFGAASAACGLAPGAVLLVVARVVQGAGAALLLPGSLAVVTDAYPDRTERARALGVWAAVSSLALPAGPILGGLVVTGGGWRWIFLVNLPIVAAATVGVLRLVPAGRPRRDRTLDVPGLVAGVVALGAAVAAVVLGGRDGLAPPVVGLAAVAVLAAAVLVTAERRAAAPMLPGALFRRPGFTGANLVAFLMNTAANGAVFVGTLHLQQALRLPPLLAGLALAPVFVPLAALSPVTGRIAARTGPWVPMAAGTAVAGAGALGLTAAGAGSYVVFLVALGVLGVGIAFVTAPAVAAAVAAAPADRSGLASGVNNAARQAGTALGVAVFGAVYAGAAAPAGLHRTGVLGAALWATALVLTLAAVRPRPGRVQPSK